MPARNVVKFDADTSALSAKLTAADRKARGLGQSFAGGAGGLDRMAARMGEIVGFSAVAMQTWQRITQYINEALQRTETLDQARSRFLSLEFAGGASEAGMWHRVIQGQAPGFRGGEQEALQAAFALQSNSQLSRGNLQAAGSLSASGQVQNMEEAINAVASASVVFNEDFTEMANAIFFAARKSQVDFGQFAKAMGEAGVMFQQVGMSSEEALATLATLRGEGIERLRTKVNALNGAIVQKDLPRQFEDLANALNQMSPKKQVETLTKEGFIGYQLVRKAREGEGFSQIMSALERGDSEKAIIAAVQQARQAYGGVERQAQLRKFEEQAAIGQEKAVLESRAGDITLDYAKYGAETQGAGNQVSYGVDRAIDAATRDPGSFILSGLGFALGLGVTNPHASREIEPPPEER